MKKIVLWALGTLVVLIGAAALLIGRIDTDFVVARIADATARATGKPLLFSSAPGLSLLPPGVSFGEARWGEIKDGKGMAVSVKGGMAQLELMPLLSGTIVVREVRLDNPVLEIRGTLDADKPSQTEQAPASTTVAASPSDSLPVELMRLVVRRGEIIYAADDTHVRIKDLNISIENLRSREEADVQCDFALSMPKADKAAALSGNLALSAKLRYVSPEITLRRVLLTFTPLSGLLPKEAGPIQLNFDGRVNTANLSLHLNKLTLQSPQLTGSLGGNAIFSPPSFTGTLEVEASPRKVAALANVKLKPANPPTADALTLKCALDYAGTTLRMRNLDARLDAVPLRGSLNLTLGTLLGVAGDLQLGALNLNAYLPLPTTAPADKGKVSASGASAITSGKTSGKTSGTTSAAQNYLSMPRLDLHLTVASVQFDTLGLKDITTTLKGAQGKYALAPLAFTLASGGSVKGSAETDLSTKAYSLTVAAQGVQVGALLEAMGKGRLADGSAALTANISTRGENAAAMQASLNGKGTLDIRNLAVSGIPALARTIPGLKAVPERFDLLRIPFTIARGEVLAQPITLNSRELNATGRATASLPRSYLDAALNVKTLGVNVPVTAKGPFNDISFGVDPKFALDMATTLPGALLQKGAEGGGNAGSTIKDKARDAGGLIKGLLGR